VWQHNWTAPRNPADTVTYKVTASARHGSLGLAQTLQIERPAKPADGNRSITSAYYEHTDTGRSVMTGWLNASTSALETFDGVYQSCQDTGQTGEIEITVISLDRANTHDVDLTVRTNTTTSYNATGNASDPSITFTPTTSPLPFTTTVANDKPREIGYEVHYTTHCRKDSSKDHAQPDDDDNDNLLD